MRKRKFFCGWIDKIYDQRINSSLLLIDQPGALPGAVHQELCRGALLMQFENLHHLQQILSLLLHRVRGG